MGKIGAQGIIDLFVGESIHIFYPTLVGGFVIIDMKHGAIPHARSSAERSAFDRSLEAEAGFELVGRCGLP